jgi:hypothetical protein
MSVALFWQIPCGGLDTDSEQVYDIPDALDPEGLPDIAIFLNGKCSQYSCKLDDQLVTTDPRTVAALHAPTSKNFTSFVEYIFAGDNKDHSKTILCYLVIV